MFKTVRIRDGHDNFFTPLRMIFALMVVFGHAVVVAKGSTMAEPRIFFEYRPSYLAVNLFFIASGFLVTKSMLYRGEMADYTSARVLRIFPALAVHVLFVMFVVGPFVTTTPLAAFFTDPQFFTQPLQVLSFYETNMVLPGTFEPNAEQLGSAALWTLRYEVLAYIGTAAVFALGFMTKRWMLALQFVGFACLFTLATGFGLMEHMPATVGAMLRFGVCYGLGAAIFAYRDRLSFHWVGMVVLGCLAYLSHPFPFFEVVTTLWVGYFVFWIAYMKMPKLAKFQKMEDTSYGIYIYHWVILQWIIYVIPGISWWTLLLLCLPVTMALALLSWRFVEKPMLSKKTAFASFLRRGRNPSKQAGPIILQD